MPDTTPSTPTGRSHQLDDTLFSMPAVPATPPPGVGTVAPPDQHFTAWPHWQRIGFRFVFVYLLLQTRPWTWFNSILGIGSVTRYYRMLDDWAVRASNARFFHVREILVPMNGSGDTSWAWAQLWLYLTLAAIACVAWTVLDRRRAGYPRLLYWLRTIARYYLAIFALSYGIIKLFSLQMSFPTLSQLSTPLGDFLPMRFSWLFVGYSQPYEVFSGVVETTAGLLLLYRRTVTLGLIAAAGAFLNVVMINLSYDVPVKLFALHLLLTCVFLLALDAKRLLTLFVLNRPVAGTAAFEPRFTRPWQRYAGVAVKLVMVYLFVVVPFRGARQTSSQLAHAPVPRPFTPGVYDVRRYDLNGRTIPALLSDSVRWRDVIFDNAVQGSINTTDALFWQRYRRGYFRFKADTGKHTVAVWKTSTALDSVFLFTMRYEIPDSTTVRLWTKIRNDSVYAELTRTNRHFQLSERQFHWLSEYNR